MVLGGLVMEANPHVAGGTVALAALVKVVEERSRAVRPVTALIVGDGDVAAAGVATEPVELYDAISFPFDGIRY